MKKNSIKVSSKMENVDEILEEFKNGSERALAYFHKKHFAALFNFTLSIVKQDDIAKDIVSNSFFKLWKNKEKIDKPNNLPAYLYTSAKNECFTYLDKQKRESKHMEGYKRLLDQFEELEIKEFQGKTILYERILIEINNLPNRCRTIMQYTFFKDMGNREIAKLLNISVNTIKNQKTKGLKVLRQKLKALYETILSVQTNGPSPAKPPSLKSNGGGSKGKWNEKESKKSASLPSSPSEKALA